MLQTIPKDATDAGVEWGFTEEVKRTRQEPLYKKLQDRLLAFDIVPKGFCRLSGAIHHPMYTTSLAKTIPCHGNHGGTNRMVYDQSLDDSCD